VNGFYEGAMDRRSRKYRMDIGQFSSSGAGTIDIIVEAMGRVNFGREVHDRKGLHGPVRLGDVEIKDWEAFFLPLDDKMLASLEFSSDLEAQRQPGPVFVRATITVDNPGDTFLDVRHWGKGYAWVNGHNLGRFWNIGPQQTMYVPGPWLKQGDNEIVILDLTWGLHPADDKVSFVAEPILNELHPELDLIQPEPNAKAIDLTKLPLIYEGAFDPGTSAQTVMFEQPAKGRAFALETRSAHDNQPFAAIAELTLLDPNGEPLDATATRVAAVDSEEKEREDGSAGNAIDGQTANFWHTEWGAAQPPHPHQLVLDLGGEQTIGGFRYTPRQGAPNQGGRIKDYRIHIGTAPAIAP
jgi:beta-galactosidase